MIFFNTKISIGLTVRPWQSILVGRLVSVKIGGFMVYVSLPEGIWGIWGFPEMGVAQQDGLFHGTSY